MPKPTTSPAVRNVQLDGEKNLFLELSGDLDLQVSPPLRNQLTDLIEAHAPMRLILNMAGVTYIDSSSLAVLVEIRRIQRKAGRVIAMTNVQPRVLGLLKVAKLHTIFNVVDTREAALAL